MNNSSEPVKKSTRLVSLDVMRGFTMFWIIGGATLIESLGNFGNFGNSGIISFLIRQVDHSTWEGLRFYDCIWPGFMLMVGVSIPFSYAKRSQSQSYSKMLGHAFKRFVILFLLGSMRESVSRGSLHLIELSSALQPIAIAYFISFLLVRTSWKIQALTAILILLIYGLGLEMIPVPGIGSGSYVKDANLVWYIDKMLLPGRIEDAVFLAGWGTLISMIPPISTTLLGLLIGRILISGRSQIDKLKILGLTSIILIITGYLISLVVPVIMKLWTVSYGVLSAGWACFVLTIFYAVIDILGKRRWAFFFVVIGMNALAVYMAGTFVRLTTVTHILTSDIATALGSFGDTFTVIIYLLIEWFLLQWLFKRKLFLSP